MDTGEGISRASIIRSRPNFTPIGPRTPFSAETRTLPTVREDLQEVSAPVPQDSDTHPPAYSTLTEPTVSESSQSPSPPPRIPPPPKVKFESEQVEWKALPLEAALWTFSSTELQQIVSRAIRSSASESFIRLLTIENVDQVLPAELQRLEQLKASMQSKYRFLVHRRTMVLQALIANVQISSFKDKEKEDIVDSVTKLAMQLSETTSECDRILEELLKISDRTTQINRMLDTHFASALAIAIRKLNNSYARRTTDLQQTRERMTQLEAELEDAWNEAEKLAKEMDDYEAELEPNDEAVIETAEVVPIPISPTTPRPQSGTLLNVEPALPRSPLTPRHTEPMADIPADVNGQEDNQDSGSIRSVRSTRSAKSTRSTVSTRGELTHSMSVSAARTRSSRTSHGSLRLPSLHSRKQSNSRPKTPADVQPPVPDLPLRFTSQPFGSSVANASSVLLHGESPDPSPRVSARTLTDESSRSVTPPASRIRANLDDIILNDNMIEEVPRSPKWKNSSLDDIRLIRKSNSRGSAGISPIGHSPSIWRNIDTPKTPAERVESLMRHSSKATPYQKIKTLTKRYSLPFPLLTSAKSVASRRSSNRS